VSEARKPKREERESANRARRAERPEAIGRSGQAGAVNRSRPIYEQPPRRSRRPRPSPNGPVAPAGRTSRGNWRTPQGAQRPSESMSPRKGPYRGRQAPAAETDRESEAPPLPSDPREAALRILHAVDTRSAFSDRLLDGAHARSGAEPKDQALMHELVKGTLRWRGRIDHILDRLIHIGISQVQPWVKNIMRMGAYQVVFLDRIPAHAAVDEAVKLAHKYGHPGTAGLVNSVLRRLVEEKDSWAPPLEDDAVSLSAWGSHPLWITERWLERFGPESTRELLVANNRAVPVGLRANRIRGTRDQLVERLVAEGVQATPARFATDLVWVEFHHAPGSLQAFQQGCCTVQDESEALVSRLVAPQAHERVLDLCAAPGGKCTHLAELMNDDGEVWAMERAEPRVRSLEANIERLGLHSIHVVHGDGRNYAFPMPFDRVLVDAPCSGLGVLGRRADARWRKGPEILREMPPLQLELLLAAGRHVRPGGVLVYSVCSFEPEESTAMVERFLHSSPSFVLESASGLLPDEVVDENGFMQILPHVHGCDGAFAARFRKT
jgi:16S rRNA (cytosine967-C5)-methyltransferase